MLSPFSLNPFSFQWPEQVTWPQLTSGRQKHVTVMDFGRRELEIHSSFLAGLLLVTELQTYSFHSFLSSQDKIETPLTIAKELYNLVPTLSTTHPVEYLLQPEKNPPSSQICCFQPAVRTARTQSPLLSKDNVLSRWPTDT